MVFFVSFPLGGGRRKIPCLLFPGYSVATLRCNNSNLGERDRKNVALAADWFWKSEKESDRVDKFIQLWVCIEALEMINTDIKPISEQLANITTEDYSFWKEPIGRLFGKRSNLVHGNSNEVAEYEVITLRGIAKILLANRLGKIENQELTQEVTALVKSHYKKTNNE